MIVEGQAFFLSSATGDVGPGTAHGLFVGDTRFLEARKVAPRHQGARQ